jgi:23S rRNA (cytosine1962-C5)-methyltransferase
VGIQEISLPELQERLAAALGARKADFQPGSTQALRLFNGFSEGYPDLVVELFGKTLLIFDHSRTPQAQSHLVQEVLDFYLQALPEIEAMVLKTRYADLPAERKGKLIFGTQADTRIQEHGTWYAIDLLMNQDASLYLDTGNVRLWALEHLQGKRVLNTFAYTGSLGVAAKAAGASQVYQLDLNQRFLQLAKRSYKLNGFDYTPAEFLAGNFFTWISRLKRAGELFDCIFLDPPYFSITTQGKVDQANEAHRLINKVRPLIRENGWLVAINNSLFTSGADYLQTLHNLCADGYLAIEELIPVPAHASGYAHTIRSQPPADPAPFNHPTKIAVLRITQRKT